MFDLPPRLKLLEESSDGHQWLRQLPLFLQALTDRWSLRLEPPYEQSNVSIVFPVVIADRLPGVLKVQFPHPECEYEAAALRCWKGQGTVRLLAHDPARHALLMERCEPGSPLSDIDATEALRVFIDLLPRLWIGAEQPFRSLRDECLGWTEHMPSSWERAGRPFEVELLETALEALEVLPANQGEQVLLHQDLHADNVLRAQREPWLVIDPKPLVGEREFSLAPIIRGCELGHSREHVVHRLNTLTGALGLDRERARLWALAQTLAWAFEGDRVFEEHVKTARWLWQA